MANTLICKQCKKNEVRCVGLCANCYAQYIKGEIRKRTSVTITVLQKGWSRYGGVNNGYQILDERKEWNCQACGIEQPSQISASLFPFEESEVLRICPPCENLVIKKQIAAFTELLKLVR